MPILNTMGNKIFFIFCLIGLISCEPEKILESSDPDVVINQIKGSPSLVQEKHFGKVSMELIRLTPDIIVAKELKAQTITEKEVGDRLEALENKRAAYLKFYTQSGNVIQQSIHDPNAVMNYLNFDIRQDFFIECNGVVKPCDLVLYSNSHGLKPSIELMLEFDKPESEEYKIIYQDQLFDLGKVKFHVDESKDEVIKLKHL